MSKNNQATQPVEAPHAIVEVAQPPLFDLGEALKAAGTKSALIRKLAGEGKSRSDIAKMLNIRYQHVRNVLTAPLKAKAE